jgi:hypothetical protein
VSDEDDPEVLADYRARMYPTRSASTVDHATWKPAPAIGEWPCRVKNCRVPVEITQDAVDHLAMFNRILVGRGEEPIDKSEVMICPAHVHLLKARGAQRRAEQRERCAVAVRAMKQSRNPRNETALIAELNKCDHPDVQGLIDSIEARLQSGGGSKRNKAAGS